MPNGSRCAISRRAIDEYSVSETERILEEAGYVAARLEAPPAVAFIDLTGFTRLTEERGDEVAAAIAMRLGELTVGHGPGGAAAGWSSCSATASSSASTRRRPPPTRPSTSWRRWCRRVSSGHAGLASGPLIARDGDIFGRTVNLAARVADATPDGHLYAPAAVAAALPPDRFDLRPVDGAVLQGIGGVALVDVIRSG